MNLLLPHTISRIITVTCLCIVYAFLSAFAVSGLVEFSYTILVLMALLDAMYFALLSVFLQKAIRFGNYVQLERYQRFINYSALGLLSVVVWGGLSLLTSYVIVGSEGLGILWRMMPFKIFVAILVYIVVVQLIHNWVNEGKSNVPPEENDDTFPTNTENTNGTIEILDRVVVKTGQKIHVINVADIIYIQSDGDYVQLFTTENHFLKEDTMKYFETHLSPEKFVRVHRSYIVNVEKILRIELYEKRNQMLTLANGHKIKASASGYKLLKDALSL